MSNVNDLYELIQDIVYEETIYLRHYIGKVVDNLDPLKKGRIKITIPELGLDTPDLALWCWPRQGSGLSIPAKGKYAEVYFINGDRTKGAYLYPASEIIDNIPTKYNGKVSTHILFENSKNKSFSKYNELSDLFTIKNKNTDLLTELKLDSDAMTELQTAITGWSPVPEDGGAALKTALTTFLSLVMADYTKILESD